MAKRDAGAGDAGTASERRVRGKSGSVQPSPSRSGQHAQRLMPVRRRDGGGGGIAHATINVASGKARPRHRDPVRCCWRQTTVNSHLETGRTNVVSSMLPVLGLNIQLLSNWYKILVVGHL